jgi:hypothetical protein
MNLSQITMNLSQNKIHDTIVQANIHVTNIFSEYHVSLISLNISNI